MRPTIRCAIYTRKSSQEGLEQSFNSLHAQREACEAYVLSQRQEGWTALPEPFDDGGFSGGNLERPALRRMLAAIDAGEIDVVVVYKIDRLSRSLMDFAQIVRQFERRNVTFVAVTQSFNTTTSMGRLTLNMLLSFAQFERELQSDRLRDKFALSRARGLWTSGGRPYGYRVQDLRLLTDPAEAKVLRLMFRRYPILRSAQAVADELAALGHLTHRGGALTGTFVLRRLQSRLYRGELVHRGRALPGNHVPIVTERAWRAAQAVLEMSARRKGAAVRRSITVPATDTRPS